MIWNCQVQGEHTNVCSPVSDYVGQPPGHKTLTWKKYLAFSLKIMPVSSRVTLSTFHCFRFISFVLKVHFEFLKFWDEGNVPTLKSSPSPQQSWWKMKIDCPDFNILRSGRDENEKVGWKMKMDDAGDFNIIGFGLLPTLLITLNSMKDMSSPTSPAQNLLKLKQWIMEHSPHSLHFSRSVVLKY